MAREADVFKNRTQADFDLIVIDVTDVSDMPRLVAAIQSRNPNGKIVIATSAPTWGEAREAFYMGAADYLRKQPDVEEMVASMKGVLIKTRRGNESKGR